MYMLEMEAHASPRAEDVNHALGMPPGIIVPNGFHKENLVSCLLFHTLFGIVRSWDEFRQKPRKVKIPPPILYQGYHRQPVILPYDLKTQKAV